MGIIIKKVSDSEEYHNPADDVVLRSDEVIIKRFRLNYTIPQKVRLGMLPYSALEEYERQKALKAEAAAQEAAAAEAEAAAAQAATEAPAEEAPKKNHTFWEDDDGNRENLSQADYEKFLAENSITLNNPMDMIAGMLGND